MKQGGIQEGGNQEQMSTGYTLYAESTDTSMKP